MVYSKNVDHVDKMRAEGDAFMQKLDIGEAYRPSSNFLILKVNIYS